MPTRGLIVVGAVTVALSAGSITAVAAARDHTAVGWSVTHMRGQIAACTVPNLAGQRVSVLLADMGGSRMMGTAGGSRMMGTAGGSRMMLRGVPQKVAAGKVSITAINHGSRTHELVVLPLGAGARVGTRTIGTDNAVSEARSVGEASNNCGSGAGEGIRSGAAGWVTLILKPGRYELVCNLPGHYAAGMYAELDVA